MRSIKVGEILQKFLVKVKHNRYTKNITIEAESERDVQTKAAMEGKVLSIRRIV